MAKPYEEVSDYYDSKKYRNSEVDLAEDANKLGGVVAEDYALKTFVNTIRDLIIERLESEIETSKTSAVTDTEAYTDKSIEELVTTIAETYVTLTSFGDFKKTVVLLENYNAELKKLLYLSGSSSITGNLIPKSNNSIDLGNDSAFWRAVYVSYIKAYQVEVYGDTPYIDFHYKKSTGDYTARIIQSASNTLLCVGTNKDNFYFTVQGFVQAYKHIFGYSGAYMQDDSNGNVFICTGASQPIYCRSITDFNNVHVPIHAGGFITDSSKRYKENIREMTEEEGNLVDKINVVNFDYKVKENGTNKYGVVAEELYEIIPGVVYLKEIDGKEVPDSVAYPDLIPFLIKKIQNQNEKINQLEERLNKIEEALKNE